MVAFHVWFVPFVAFVFIRLLGKKHIKDAVLFFGLTLVGYGLWLGTILHHPLIITICMAKIIDALKWWD